MDANIGTVYPSQNKFGIANVELSLYKVELVSALMVLILTIVFVPGTNAMFTALLVYGPTIPGPLTKKPKMSLKFVPTNSGYSEDPKTN